MPLITALRRQRQVVLCEFKASLVYKATKQVLKQPGLLCRETLPQNPILPPLSKTELKNRCDGDMAQ